MRCKNCDYPLWNIKARACPECGAPFRPSEREFVPNAVRFCCPYCDQSYYGTGERGHLVPTEFECVSCHRQVAMDDMVLRPTEGVTEAQTLVDTMPWFDRDQRGVIRAWLATIAAALTRPQSLMRAIPQDVSMGRAWLYMYVTNAIFLLVGQIIPSIVILSIVGFVGRSSLGGAMLGRMVLQQGIVQQLVILGSFAVLPLLWVWLTHGLLVLTGGAAVPMRRTAQAIFYSAGANALFAVPACGCVHMAGYGWWLVSATLMTKSAHGCHGGRAAFAVITPTVLLGAGFVALVMLVALAPSGMLGRVASGGWSGGMPPEVQPVLRAVLSCASPDDGRGPGHALLLVTSGQLAAGDLLGRDSQSSMAGTPTADTTLERFQLLPPNRQQLVAQAAAAALPADTVAHRLGDFVFTYHGVDLSAPDAKLWLVVFLPDPEQNLPLRPLDPIFVGLGDGTVEALLLAELPEKLTRQNAYRAALGLPPLPDPRSVTHSRPARAPLAAEEVPGSR